jgi:hypothetical protein
MEIGLEEIKYKNFDNPDGPVIVISKTDVIEITYQNGSKFFIAPDPYDVNKEVAIRNKSKCIKFEFFSPLTNDIAFGYETMLKVGTNLEFKIGIIGPGTRKNTDRANGVFFKGGVKFLTSPTYIQNGIKYAHQLKGFYIKPELIFNTFSIDKYSGGTFYFFGPYTPPIKSRVKYTNIAVNIVFGKQYILGNVMTLDYYFGAGYGLQSSNSDNDLYSFEGSESYSYSHLYFGNDSPLIITGGLTIGVLF